MVRILAIDDHPLIAKALEALFAEHEDMQLVATGKHGSLLMRSTLSAGRTSSHYKKPLERETIPCAKKRSYSCCRIQANERIDRHSITTG
ncbi:MAG: hypothetical protein ACOYYS_23440 [Chloroflexota bacterium]